jgi:hypothetical protein
LLRIAKEPSQEVIAEAAEKMHDFITNHPKETEVNLKLLKYSELCIARCPQ